MNLEDLGLGQRRVLAVLENAWNRAREDASTEWVATIPLANHAGIRFGGRIHEMDNRTHPARGLGFRIGRRPQKHSGMGPWEYRLEGYPEDWKRPKVPEVVRLSDQYELDFAMSAHG